MRTGIYGISWFLMGVNGMLRILAGWRARSWAGLWTNGHDVPTLRAASPQIQLIFQSINSVLPVGWPGVTATSQLRAGAAQVGGGNRLHRKTGRASSDSIVAPPPVP